MRTPEASTVVEKITKLLSTNKSKIITSTAMAMGDGGCTTATVLGALTAKGLQHSANTRNHHVFRAYFGPVFILAFTNQTHRWPSPLYARMYAHHSYFMRTFTFILTEEDTNVPPFYSAYFFAVPYRLTFFFVVVTSQCLRLLFIGISHTHTHISSYNRTFTL